MKASKIVPCVDCNEEFPRKELNRNGRCHRCAWNKMGEVVHAIHTKTGPEYEKWRQAVQAAAAKL